MRNFQRKMRAAFAAAALAALGGGSALATGYPVLDISNLMNAIQQLYATYDEINTAIEQVQNTYQQLQKQIDSVRNMNWDDLKGSFDNWDDSGGIQGVWNNIGNFRTNLTNATSAINENMNLINDVKNTLNNKTVTMFGKKYSVGGLFGVGQYGQNNLLNLPASASDYVRETGSEIAAGYAGKLTYKQKEAVMKKWGLDPENYAYVKLVEEQANEGISQLVTKGSDEYYTAELTKAAANNEALLGISNAGGESMTAQVQATTGAILSLKDTVLNLTHGLRETGAAWAKESVRKQIAEDAAREKAANDKDRRDLEYQKNTAYINSWL